MACGLLATEPDDATRRWWGHVRALSGDEFLGRDTGSEGYRKAAGYVVAQDEDAAPETRRVNVPATTQRNCQRGPLATQSGTILYIDAAPRNLTIRED